MPEGDSPHAQHILSALNQQRAGGKFCDAELHVEGGVVHLAHRCILACFSELFQEPPTASNPRVEFSLQGCPSSGLELLLNFVYTGELKLDPDNLDQVRHAASSLGIPQALVLCEQFKDSCRGPGPVKRRRGRPRKSAADMAAVKEESLSKATKVESGFDTNTASLTPAPNSSSATTTRSGRVIKGPKRLVTIDDSSVSDSQRNTSSPAEAQNCEVAENTNSHQPPGETEVTKQQVDLTTCSVSQVTDEDEDAVEDLEAINEDTDEEYVPAEEPAPSPPSTSTSHKARQKDGEAVEEDSSKESVQCPICMKSFKSKYYMKVHNRRHTGERPFGCNKCGKRYFRKENLLIHEMRDCAQAQTYSCPTCSSIFKSKEELSLHVVSHTGEMPHKCSTCPEQFMYKKNLTVHMMKVHGYPKPHACSQCAKTFLTRTELRVHEAAKHRGEKPYVCEECGHRASSRNGLQMHIKAIHRNERPFVCSHCSHAFSQKNNLNMHLRIHSGEKPYQCHLCGKTFRTQASLDKHHRTHTGERPFSCDVCEQRFTEKGALARHKASKHEEGRPHCCHICGKTFKAKEQLRVHLRRHIGMRKFECVDCGYKFTRQAHLRRHSQIHKRTENYNPRQRKLRNVIVQEVEGSPGDNEAVKDSPAAVGMNFDVQTVAESDPLADLASGCIVRVVVGAGVDAVMEEVVTNQNLQVEAEQSFSVAGEMQQTQLVTQTYESAVDMEGIAESTPESKT